MSKTKAGRPRTKIWDEFEDDPVLAMKRYCRCKWCGADVKADAARMYNHVTDRCTRIDEARRQSHQVRAQENDGGVDAVSDMDDEGKDLTNATPSTSNTAVHRAVGVGKAKGGRPKDPIWNEFRTNDDLRIRRYCICVWCDKEVKGDTTRMTAHVVERCTAVDVLTKAKYTVKHRKLDDSRDHNSALLATNLPTAPMAPLTSTPASPVIPISAPPSPPPAAIVDVATLVASPPSPPAPLQHQAYPMLHAESPPNFTVSHYGFLKELGLHGENRGVYGGGDWFGHGPVVATVNPSTNESIASVQCGTRDDYMHVVRAMDVAAISWRQASTALRSAVVHQIGAAFRSHQRGLAHLVAMELGVVLDEAMRHVGLMIQSCDAAATAVRTLPASTVQEPVDHAGDLGTTNVLVVERHVPLAGHVGLLTPFHAPMWTGAMALACGNAVLWKPSLMLTAIAITRLISTVLVRNGFPPACASLICGSGPDIGACLAQDKRMAVVCYKGCVDQGHRVNMAVAERMGQCMLDLDTQNAIVVHADANVDHAVRMVVHAMGRRILRRVYVHVDVCDAFRRLLSMYFRDIVVGDPFHASTTCGPLRNHHAVQAFSNTLNTMVAMPYGQILCGGNALERRGNFVAPTAILVDELLSNVHVDALSPVTFVSTIQSHDQVMEERQPLERIVLFTQSSLTVAFQFPGANVVGVNCEFPRDGHKFATSWMTFMRRTTCTVNTAATNSQVQQSQQLMDPSAQITSLHVL